MSKQILIIGPAWVGDMVMAHALFRLLKQRQPDVEIDVLAPIWTLGLLERMPEVRNPLMMPIKHRKLELAVRYRLGQQLRKTHYDQAILLPNSLKSALVPFWAKINHRTGWLGEYRWGLLNDIRYLNKNALPLMVERFVALGLNKHEPLPTDYPHPKLSVNAKTVADAQGKFRLSLERPVLALCPGAEFGPAKQWPTEYYADIAKSRIAAGWQVWIVGSKNDRAAADSIKLFNNNEYCINLAGDTDLGEAIDLLSLANQVLTNDSGLMHIAAALNKPLVSIYGSSDPRFTPPLSQTAKTIALGLSCSPCFKRECPLTHLRCLRDLLPSQVLLALNTLPDHATTIPVK